MSSQPVSNTTFSPETLNRGAEYGNLPFDRFAVTHWDYAKPVQQDQEQWNELAKRWLSMSHAERNPYWDGGSLVDSPPPDAPYLPMQDQIDRILAPHQTIKERNISQCIGGGSHDPVWVRACYAPDLDSAYEEMREAGRSDFEPNLVLDDGAVYASLGLDQDWTRIFLRLPLLPDAIPYLGDPETDEPPSNLLPPAEESWMPLYDACLKDKSVIYLLDEEALKERLIKVLFLDIHGNVVWHNKIRPEGIVNFEIHANMSGVLSEHLEKCYDEPSLLQPGALLELDDY